MSPAMQKKKDDLGAGLRVSKQNIENHPAGPPRHGELTQAERAFTLASTFLSGVLAISASQLLGAPLKLIDPVFYEGYMAYTKECFAVLITCLTQWWAPTVVRVSGDSSMLGQLTRKPDGSLECKFEDRLLLMANHQLYTDWLYLWWIAYTNNMHGFVYIILKESLKHIPIIGWGAQFYNFIFLSRKWEQDERTFKQHLSKLNKPNDPMWLIIFPEGTNLSASTREKSQQWAKKNGLKDMKHQLLPRSTGLRFCLNELEDTTKWLYDCTIAYEGVPDGQFGQDIFTLRSSFFEGRPPKSVNMHWRRFHIDDIPIKNTKAFEVWLRNRWREKDYMLEYFRRNNRFPAEDFWKEHLDMGSSGSQSLRSVPRPAITIETEVKSGNWNEFIKIFAPISSVMMALTVAYGAKPDEILGPGGMEFLEKNMKAILAGGEIEVTGLPGPEEIGKLIESASKIGAMQAKGPQSQGKGHQLTQENLAKLVKETALKNGMMPGGLRRASTALPAVTAPPNAPSKASNRLPTRPKSTATVPNTSRKPAGTVKKTPTPIKTKAAAATGPTQTVMTSSGVMIKIPKPQVEEAKKTGTIVTKNGLVIKLGKDEIEEAQAKKGTTIMTSSGVPIKISPSGDITLQPKTGRAQQAKKSPLGTKVPAASPSTPRSLDAVKKQQPPASKTPAAQQSTNSRPPVKKTQLQTSVNNKPSTVNSPKTPSTVKTPVKKPVP
ncbi:acyltransferase-domain-containing protein [Aaosphaeria arxii CBS 175.79]|uniref:Acyltransferase-domain-containing protein n=1 Tax=Aaosphaeria arxii CBS 175.79 TaxID=1450172 RepID=A0A6A5X6F3_9PLEO|nr:acyltransferase-domain-containing protein [Aaosphaeria arxii CBS 175.79]KAF2008446.1 acyltransferase-domain-containing protein [Aaosphaeria arxii CBS 175.79]